jgi:hypothetical protein
MREKRTAAAGENDALPSPLRGGVGGRGPRMQFVVGYPPPRPSPARGEGVHRRCGNDALHFIRLTDQSYSTAAIFGSSMLLLSYQ